MGEQGKKSNDANPAAIAMGIILTAVLIFILTFGGIIINYLIDGNNSGTTGYTYREKPESAVMRSFVHEAFGKDYAMAEQSEYASIKYIYIDKDDDYLESGESFWIIKYSDKIGDSEMPEDLKTVTVDGSEELQLRDFQAFTGLEEIRLSENVYANWDSRGYGYYDLKNLSNLKRICIPNSYLSDMNDAFEKPEDIEKINAIANSVEDIETLKKFTGIKSFTFSFTNKETAKNLDFLNVFTKLEEAVFDFGGESADLSPIASLTGLKRLSIVGNENLKGISVLYGMPKLEELQLKDLPQIKDIGFVNSMPNLFKLSLENCGVGDISAVKNNIVLQELKFIYCDNLYDISAVSSVQNLNKLVFQSYNSNLVGENLSNLKLLEEVWINADLLNMLKGSEAVRKLTVLSFSEDGSYADSISSMINLEEIELTNKSLRSDQEDMISVISKLTKLRKITGIHNSFYDSETDEIDASPLFASNSIEEMIFPIINGKGDDNSVEISLSNMKDNTVLKKLDIRHFHIRNVDDGGERPYFIAELPKLGGYANIFLSKFKAVEELNVEDCGLDNLEFVRSMPELRVIDLSDNSVTDISPLLDCKKLEKVICTNNGFVNTSILPENVVVIGN